MIAFVVGVVDFDGNGNLDLVVLFDDAPRLMF